jgi:hypothetical protein
MARWRDGEIMVSVRWLRWWGGEMARWLDGAMVRSWSATRGGVAAEGTSLADGAGGFASRRVPWWATRAGAHAEEGWASGKPPPRRAQRLRPWTHRGCMVGCWDGARTRWLDYDAGGTWLPALSSSASAPLSVADTARAAAEAAAAATAPGLQPPALSEGARAPAAF